MDGLPGPIVFYQIKTEVVVEKVEEPLLGLQLIDELLKVAFELRLHLFGD